MRAILGRRGPAMPSPDFDLCYYDKPYSGQLRKESDFGNTSIYENGFIIFATARSFLFCSRLTEHRFF